LKGSVRDLIGGDDVQEKIEGLGWRGMMRTILRSGESSWLCMKFEFAFFAGRSILIRVLQFSFLALGDFFMRFYAFCSAIFARDLLHNFLLRFP
jgi:hypothetical protein